MKVKYLILGAGPAGLTFANMLQQAGEQDFLVLEKEREAGGLCRSEQVDGAPFDIGGGHFLDVRRPKVNEFLFQFMPENEWNLFNRDSKIIVEGNSVDHPIEANIWQMKQDSQVEYLKSIAIAGCNLGQEMPDKFIDWIYWKLGDKIAESYMIPYNQKMFSKNLNQLGTYWLEKLPNVSFDETLLSCLNRKPYGTQPGHAQFYYPKQYGYGELWLRMADELGERIKYEVVAEKLDFNLMRVNDIYEAECIITTVPWTAWKEIEGMPGEIKESISKLRHSSIQTEYFSENLDTTAHWLYYPAPELAYHRILVRHNFCTNAKGYWTETNSERIAEKTDNYHYMNEYAYPMNTIDKPQIMEKLLKWCEEKKVYGLGRWGEHQHYNSDVTVDLAMKMADKLLV